MKIIRHNKLTIHHGAVFGRWTIIKEGLSIRGVRVFLCQCSCGKKQKVRLNKLTTGWSRSCGCLKAEKAKARLTTHGLSKTPEYAIWLGMKQRCYDKNSTTYKRYGGIGIQMHPSWLGNNGFVNFLNHIGIKPSKEHSIDRIDNSKGYEPGNVRWSTKIEQMANRKNTIWITHAGKRQSLADWSRETGISSKTLWVRVKKGWSPKSTIEEPVSPLQHHEE